MRYRQPGHDDMIALAETVQLLDTLSLELELGAVTSAGGYLERFRPMERLDLHLGTEKSIRRDAGFAEPTQRRDGRSEGGAPIDRHGGGGGGVR